MESEHSGDIEAFVHQLNDSFANERVFTIKTSKRSHAAQQRRAEQKKNKPRRAKRQDLIFYGGKIHARRNHR